MIRHSTTRFHNGALVKAGDPVKGTDKQKKALLNCGQAYEEDKPISEKTVKELKQYMEESDIYFSSTMNKEELLQQIDDSERNSDIS